MSKYLIGLDDGHGMETQGKRTPKLKTDLMFRGKLRKKGTIIHENDFNENIMELIEKGLDRCGIGHVQLAEGDTDIPLKNRVKKANKLNCDLVVSCHANALEGDKWQDKAYGLVVIHTENCSSTSKKLAKNCYNHLKDEVDWYKNGGTKYGVRADTDISGFTLYILRRTKASAVLLEFGFMDSWEDVKRMVTEEFQISCAEATVKGICETLGVKYISPHKEIEDKVVYNCKAKVVCDDTLNVRTARPKDNKLADIKFTLPKGSIVQIGYSYKGWCSIYTEDNYGYVNKKYLELIE